MFFCTCIWRHLILCLSQWNSTKQGLEEENSLLFFPLSISLSQLSLDFEFSWSSSKGCALCQRLSSSHCPGNVAAGWRMKWLLRPKSYLGCSRERPPMKPHHQQDNNGKGRHFYVGRYRTSMIWPRNLREMHFRHGPGAFPDFVGSWRWQLKYLFVAQLFITFDLWTSSNYSFTHLSSNFSHWRKIYIHHQPIGETNDRAVAVWVCTSPSFCGFQKISAAQSVLYDLRALNQQVFLPLGHTNENRAYYYEVLLLTRPSQHN